VSVFFLFFSSFAAEKLNLKTLREKPKADLLAKLGELKNELSQLRVAKVTGGAASKLGKMYVVLPKPLTFIQMTVQHICTPFTVVQQSNLAPEARFK
jgi:ribosomal protein L29